MGEAAQLITSLKISAANYICWAALTERYDNKTFIQKNHIKILPNVTKESFTSLRDLFG